MECSVQPASIDRDRLRETVRAKYTAVAETPEQGFHFHTGQHLAGMLGYRDEEVTTLPQTTVDSFAGTGNPFSMGRLQPGEVVLDLGAGAGFDTLLAAQQVGPAGRVIAVDMTPAMLQRIRAGAIELGLGNVETRLGYAEQIPVDDGAVDLVISNGVINLTPDKVVVLEEIRRVLKPGGRIQIADMIVHHEVPQDAREDIELWSG